ncbi:hypothetical protein ACOSP7_027733 [Xanthoceras sorbifolium]
MQINEETQNSNENPPRISRSLFRKPAGLVTDSVKSCNVWRPAAWKSTSGGGERPEERGSGARETNRGGRECREEQH